MKHFLILLFLLSAFASCDPTKVYPPAEEAEDAVVPPPIVFKGSGSDPSWDLELTQENAEQYRFDFSVDYGSEHSSGLVELTSLSTASTDMIFHGSDEEERPIKIVIVSSPCQNNTYEDFPYKMAVIWDDQPFSGCCQEE